VTLLQEKKKIFSKIKDAAGKKKKRRRNKREKRWRGCHLEVE
jgi:hypothetical protein